MEAVCTVPEDISNLIPKLRAERGEKRKTRRELRKILVKDLKKDDKGYLYIEAEEVPTEDSVIAEEVKKESNAKAGAKKSETPETKIEEAVKLKKKISSKTITVAGIAIILTVVIAMSVTSKNET
jgi:hypothetical protein